MKTADLLVMDAGQTGVRTQLRSAGQVLDGREYPGVMTDQPLLPQLADLARAALTDMDASVPLLAVGSSGLTPEMDVDDLLADLADLGSTEVRFPHDPITSYLAALGNVPGAVVAAGTGVVTLAVGEHETARVDGWGYLIGDAGSGYWIGRAALDAVMRAHDGRGPATALTPLAEAEFDDLEAAYVELQADELKVSRIASWARTVAELADDGDEVCRRISAEAGRELALSVLTGLRRVQQDGRPDPAISTVGKVFASRWVTESFADAIHERLPGARLLTPLGEGIDGAACLPDVPASSALGRNLQVASSEGGPTADDEPHGKNSPGDRQ